MLNVSSIIGRLALATALVFGAGPAFAGPTYHVGINTAGIAATTGLLDFSLSGTTDADVATITLSNFSGLFGASPDMVGDVVRTAGGYTMSTAIEAQSFLTFSVPLGGMFGFNVTFADDYAGVGTAIFQIGLFSENFVENLGLEGGLVSFELVPASGNAPSFVSVSDNNALAVITEVPEPSDLLLMLTALALAGVVTRRARKHNN